MITDLMAITPVFTTETTGMIVIVNKNANAVRADSSFCFLPLHLFAHLIVKMSDLRRIDAIVHRF